MRWVAFGTYDVDRHPRVGALIEGLRAAGDDVVEVNRPLRLDTAARVEMLRRPWRLPLLAWQLSRCWLALARGARALPADQRLDAVLVGYLGHFDVHLARLLFPRTPIVLDHLVSAAGTARDRGLADGAGAKARLLAGIDAAALRRADVVVVDTPEHEHALPSTARSRAVVVPVGATAPWFDAGATRAPARDGDPLRVVFVGLFTPLHGTRTIGEALGLLAGDDRIRVTMVGDGQERAACQALAAANPHVTWVDWIGAAQLPAAVAAHDVSLGIVGTTDKALAVVPTKAYQGAAAGCVVVTSDTAPQREALGGAAVLVPPGDAQALAAALRGLADDRDAVRRLGRAARERALDRFSAGRVVAPLRDRPLTAAAGVTATGVTATGAAGAPAELPPLTVRGTLRWAVVGPLLRGLAPASVVEMGCGQGAAGARIARLAAYTGVEPDAASCDVARARVEPRGGTVVHGDHTDLPGRTDLPDRYDLLCAFEVLEHLPDDAGVLAEWVRLVRPGGHVLFSVPAWPDRFGPSDDLVGHVRRYTPGDLTALLEKAGCTDVRVRVYGWPLGYLLEEVSNRVARRRLAAAPSEAADRTAMSGRHLQPTGGRAGLAARVVPVATVPFQLAQRLAPTRGIGLVAVATVPADRPAG